MIELAAGPLAMMAAGFAAALLVWMAAIALIARLSSIDGQLLLGSRRAILAGLAVQAIVAILVALVIALLPALTALRTGVIPRIGPTTTSGRGVTLAMQAPVTLQLSCAIGVWVLAGMIVVSVISIMRQPLGYDPAHRAVVSIWIAHGSFTLYGSKGATTEFLALNQVIRRLEAIPGVRSASYVSSPPLESRQVAVETLDNLDDPGSAPRAANRVVVTSGYFHTTGTRILLSKDLSAWLRTGTTGEIVVNALAAKELFPGQNPLQRAVSVFIPAESGLRNRRYRATIAGVVENMRTEGYASSPRPTFFEEGHAYIDGMPNLVVWGDLPLPVLENAARKIVPELMPGMEVRQVFSLDQEAQKTLAPERDRALAALVCALSMAAVTYIGLYGSLAFYLRSRRREMAVRLCLGATSWAIRRMVLALAFRCALVAALLSLPAWAILRTLSASDLLGAASWSSGRAAAITLACVLVTVLSAWMPAAAAVSISPAGILKEQ